MSNRRATLFAACIFTVGLATASFAQSSSPSDAVPPGVTITPQLQSTLNALRVQAQSQNWSFTPQITGVSGRSLKTLTGENPPTPQQLVNASALTGQATHVLELYREAVKNQGGEGAQLACNPGDKQWDWRAHSKVTKPKLQECDDCWAFATAGQIESAFLMAGWSESELSEQHVLDCSNSGDCNGGNRWTALPWAATTPIADETGYPYDHGVKNSQCKPHVGGTHKLVTAGWIDSSGDVTSTPKLKDALCQYGPISVSIYASPALQSYRGPATAVFDEHNNSNGTNHAILLVGWDDDKQAWLIKNSWGPAGASMGAMVGCVILRTTSVVGRFGLRHRRQLLWPRSS